MLMLIVNSRSNSGVFLQNHVITEDHLFKCVLFFFSIITVFLTCALFKKYVMNKKGNSLFFKMTYFLVAS